MANGVEGCTHVEKGEKCYMPPIKSFRSVNKNACEYRLYGMELSKPQLMLGRRELSLRYCLSCINTYFSTTFDKKDRLAIGQ